MKIKKEYIYLDKRHLVVAQEFLQARVTDCSEYKRRGGFKEIDILCGALGEMGVYKFLKSKGVKLSKPDFTIYDAGQKSYAADLTTKEGLQLHVKSQTTDSARLYGHSYLLQKNDPIVRNEKRKFLKDHFLVPTMVDVESLCVTIYGTVPMNLIHKKSLFGECKVPFLNKTKRAIYLEDLKRLTSKSRWKLLCSQY